MSANSQNLDFKFILKKINQKISGHNQKLIRERFGLCYLLCQFQIGIISFRYILIWVENPALEESVLRLLVDGIR